MQLLDRKVCMPVWSSGEINAYPHRKLGPGFTLSLFPSPQGGVWYWVGHNR